MNSTNAGQNHYDVVILGAGYAGLMAALHLRGRKGPRRIALVNGEDQFVERSRLQESISKPVAARIPSIAALVAGTGIDFIRGDVAELDAEARRVRIVTASVERSVTFDRAMYALGSRTDVETVPGVDAYAYRLDPGDGLRSATALRAALNENARRPLRIIVVGGGVTAIEAAGEIKARWPQAEALGAFAPTDPEAVEPAFEIAEAAQGAGNAKEGKAALESAKAEVEKLVKNGQNPYTLYIAFGRDRIIPSQE